LLWMTARLVLDPSISGFAGEYSSGDLKRTVSRTAIDTKTVSDILNYIVACDGLTSWIVQRPFASSSPIPSDEPWMMVNHLSTKGHEDEIVENLLSHFPEDKPRAPH